MQAHRDDDQGDPGWSTPRGGRRPALGGRRFFRPCDCRISLVACETRHVDGLRPATDHDIVAVAQGGQRRGFFVGYVVETLNRIGIARPCRPGVARRSGRSLLTGSTLRSGRALGSGCSLHPGRSSGAFALRSGCSLHPGRSSGAFALRSGCSGGSRCFRCRRPGRSLRWLPWPRCFRCRRPGRSLPSLRWLRWLRLRRSPPGLRSLLSDRFEEWCR